MHFSELFIGEVYAVKVEDKELPVIKGVQRGERCELVDGLKKPYSFNNNPL